MSNTTVSVIILNWNTKSLLQQYLPIVIETSKGDNIEIVVADNGSTDGSAEWVNVNYPKVKLLAFKNNLGYAGGYNKALSLVDSDLTVLLNSDVAPVSGWLNSLVATMDNISDAAGCVPKIKDFKSPGKFEYAGAAGGFIDRFGYPFCRGRIFNVAEDDIGQYDEPSRVFWASGAALMVRTKVFLDSGGLDESFFAHMEEIDWCWRIINRDFSFYYVPNSEVFHLGGGTLNYQNPNKTYLNFRNNLYMILKNKPGKRVYPLLVLRMLMDCAAMFNFLKNGEWENSKAVLRAHLSFILNFSTYFKKRQSLLPQITCFNHTLVYKGSIVVDFFIRKRLFFSEINFEPQKTSIVNL